MVSGTARESAHARIVQLAGSGLDLASFWRESSEAIAAVVPYYLAPCWFTLDPASLLATSHFQEGLPHIPQEWLAAEYYGDDFNKMADVARSGRGLATLHEATGGNPTLSARYRDGIVPYGGDQEMIVSLRSEEGSAWGALGLYRDPDRPMFGEDEKTFLSTAAPYLAEGARRGLLLGEANDPDQPYGPGLVVLADDWTLESSTPGVQELLADLPGANGREDHLPAAVLSVAGQAKRGLASASGEVAFARVRSMSGRWVLLHGVSLLSHRSRRVAVIIELAHPARISPLLMAAYKLSEREQEVTRQVLQGSATKDIAEALFISTHTVQQHLKSIFDKTGVRSRRDLVGRIFFSHYEPRLRDNEQRAVAGKPLRGGPAPPPPTPEVSGASR